jgi:2-succinyl-6-hydroxy-2,4-cyclohexadiene-1-carboxylate synthase
MDGVFVAGFTQTGASWQPVLEADASVEPDRQDGVSLEILLDTPHADSFVETAHALACQQGMYVGYSQGGRLCLQLALDRPDVVQRLVLVSASPGIAADEDRAARRAADEQLAQGIERDGVDAFLERWLAQPLFATLAPARAGLADRRAANTVDTLTHQLRVLGQGAQPSNWERLDELAIPVLLIVGELDAKYVDIAQQMASAIADARLEVVPDAGHACHLEDPDGVGHLIRSWSAA